MVVFQGDRGFDGLAGLPGEKGHRVSVYVFLSKYIFVIFASFYVVSKDKCKRLLL